MKKSNILFAPHGSICHRNPSAQNAQQQPRTHRMWMYSMPKSPGCRNRGPSLPCSQRREHGRYWISGLPGVPDCRRDSYRQGDVPKKYGTRAKFIGVSMDTDKLKLDNYTQANGVEWEQYSDFRGGRETQISKDCRIPGFLPCISSTRRAKGSLYHRTR